MHRRWLLLTAILCALLVVTTSALSGGARGRRVIERDGLRTYHRSVLGIDVPHDEPAPGLSIARELDNELVRLRLALPKTFLSGGDAVRQTDGDMVFHHLSGRFTGSAKDLVDAVAKQLSHATRRTTPAGIDEVNGTAADGKTEVEFYTFVGAGERRAELSLHGRR